MVLSFDNLTDFLIVDLVIPPVVGDLIELMYDPEEPKPDWIIECNQELWENICEEGLIVTKRILSNKDRIECNVRIWY